MDAPHPPSTIPPPPVEPANPRDQIRPREIVYEFKIQDAGEKQAAERFLEVATQSAPTTIRFWLDRSDDESGVSGTGRVAEGIRFSNGRVALSWLTKHSSVAIYDSMAEVVCIHGHGGKTKVTWQDPPPEPYNWGATNCALDACEHNPFGSAGGLAARATALVAPEYVPEDQRRDYLDGYAMAAAEAYGPDWRTCHFGWAPAIVIEAPKAEEAT
jgi:hypothetical protein